MNNIINSKQAADFYPTYQEILNYMRAEGYERGGWVVLHRMGELVAQMSLDITRLKNAIAAIQQPQQMQVVSSPILHGKPTADIMFPKVPLPTPAPAEKPIEEQMPWICLYTACHEFQKEAIEGNFNIVFNPWQIAAYIRDDKLEILKGSYRIRHESKGAKHKYLVSKNLFLQKLVEFKKYRTAREKEIFKYETLKNFVEWRTHNRCETLKNFVVPTS